MADQHNANIPALANTIAADIPDIKENLEFHKDVFENFVKTWSNTSAAGIYPHKFSDQSGTPVILKCTVFSIGDWNMDSAETKAITHSMSASDIAKIVSISGMIRNDANDTYIPILAGYGAEDVFDVNIQGVGAAEITLNRKGGGAFDSASFDSTSYNRGYVIVWFFE